MLETKIGEQESMEAVKINNKCDTRILWVRNQVLI